LSLTVFNGSDSGGGIELAKANAILDRFESWDNKFEALIPALQDVQAEYGFVPAPIAALISQRFDIPLPAVYGVSTFYTDFKVVKKAEHRILICEGMACYACGSQPLFKMVKDKLGIEHGDVTPDKKWTVERANWCFGACQEMPIVEIDHTIHCKVTPEKLSKFIDDVTAGKVDDHGHH
jgi:NADP-reducing hydrogenase subunit HndA